MLDILSPPTTITSKRSVMASPPGALDAGEAVLVGGGCIPRS
jgi:hypothetical protein